MSSLIVILILKRVLASVGPAFAVSVGYMDPGNWATDLAAGHFGAQLMGVILLANIMAIVMQVIAVRLGGATGADLATHIARRWPRYALGFSIVAQAAAVATDFAEFSGIVIGLQLLFGLSLPIAGACSALILFVILGLGGTGFRRVELFLTGCVAAISIAFVYELTRVHPAWGSIVSQSVHVPLHDAYAALVAVGIVGATVMPHNLFLHSSLIASRARGCSPSEKPKLLRLFSNETLIALNVAGLVNAAILIVGTSLPHATDSISNAYTQLGLHFAGPVALAFGAALLVAGIASSVSATVAGTVIFEGFGFRAIPLALRRCFTVGPALIATIAGVSPSDLMIWSQVALAFALPILALPLVLLTIDRATMGNFRSSRVLTAASFAVASLCIGFDLLLLIQSFMTGSSS